MWRADQSDDSDVVRCDYRRLQMARQGRHTYPVTFQRTVGLVWVVGLCLFAGSFSPGASASSAASAFPALQESCVSEESGRVIACRDFVSDVSLEPVDGGIRVSWTPGTEDFVKLNCGPDGRLGDCHIIGQSVLSTFDPVTGTGAQTCKVPSIYDRSCVMTGLRNGVQYAFRIVSTVGGSDLYGGGLLYTPWTSATASPCCSVPQAPSNLSAQVVGDALDVLWAAPPDWGGATELTYEVTTSPASAGCSAKVLACRIAGLDYGVSYSVTVRAANAAGAGPAVSSSAAYEIPKSVPDAPDAVKAKYGRPGEARVAWATPARDGGSRVTGFVAIAQPGGKSCRVGSSARGCTIAGLSGGRAYAFTVKASSAQGASGASAPAVAGVLINPASKPQDVVAKLTGNAAVVSWQAPASNGGGRLVSYVVRSFPDAGTCTTKTRTCSVVGLELAVSYRFSVVAVNTAGRGLAAESTSVTVPAPTAVAPTSTGKPTQAFS